MGISYIKIKEVDDSAVVYPVVQVSCGPPQDQGERVYFNGALPGLLPTVDEDCKHRQDGKGDQEALVPSPAISR